MDKGGRADLRRAMGPPAAVMDAGRGRDPIVAVNKGLPWFSARLWREGVVMHLQVGKGPGHGIGGPAACREAAGQHFLPVNSVKKGQQRQ